MSIEDKAWELADEKTGTSIWGIISDLQCGRILAEGAESLLVKQCKVFHESMDELAITDDVNPEEVQ